MGQDAKSHEKLWILLPSLVVFFVLLVGSTFGHTGLLRVLELNKRLAAVRLNIQKLNREIYQLSETINLLRFDGYTIEAIAREELGLSRPDEMVFEIIDDRASSR